MEDMIYKIKDFLLTSCGVILLGVVTVGFCLIVYGIPLYLIIQGVFLLFGHSDIAGWVTVGLVVGYTIFLLKCLECI